MVGSASARPPYLYKQAPPPPLMNKMTVSAALLLAACPVALTSCSRSAADVEMDMISAVEDLSAVLAEATPDHLDTTLNRVEAIGRRIQKLREEEKTYAREEIDRVLGEESCVQRMRQALSAYLAAAGKFDTMARSLPDATVAQQICDKVRDIMK